VHSQLAVAAAADALKVCRHTRSRPPHMLSGALIFRLHRTRQVHHAPSSAFKGLALEHRTLDWHCRAVCVWTVCAPAKRASILSTQYTSSASSPSACIFARVPDDCSARYSPPLPSGALAICATHSTQQQPQRQSCVSAQVAAAVESFAARRCSSTQMLLTCRTRHARQQHLAQNNKLE
jgi:hypothetical protein